MPHVTSLLLISIMSAHVIRATWSFQPKSIPVVVLALCVYTLPAAAQENISTRPSSQSPDVFSEPDRATWKGAFADSLRLLTMGHLGQGRLPWFRGARPLRNGSPAN